MATVERVERVIEKVHLFSVKKSCCEISKIAFKALPLTESSVKAVIGEAPQRTNALLHTVNVVTVATIPPKRSAEGRAHNTLPPAFSYVYLTMVLTVPVVMVQLFSLTAMVVCVPDVMAWNPAITA